MDDQQHNVIDELARARQWRRSRSKPARPASEAAKATSDAPKSIADSLLFPANMLTRAASVDDQLTDEQRSGTVAQPADPDPGALIPDSSQPESAGERNVFLDAEADGPGSGGRTVTLASRWSIAALLTRGGQTVEVLTAADNGRGNFRLAAIATTAANGGWSARLPAGPSRLVSALHAGGPTTEGSTSAQVNLIVPTKVELLSASPRRVPWGGTVHLVGQLKRRIPPSGWSAGPLADRAGIRGDDLRHPGARHGQRTVLDHIHVR